jgi:hypothetical protein
MSSNSLAITPRYVQGVGAKATTAQTDQTGATASNIVTAYTAKAASAPGSTEGQGALIQDVIVRVPVTSAAAVWVIYRNASSVRYVIKTGTVSAITVSATVPGYDSTKIVLNEFLQPGDKIDVQTTVTQETHFSFNVGEY